MKNLFLQDESTYWGVYMVVIQTLFTVLAVTGDL
jgi:hypothetical protein